jgi:ElaB/YqjD/DUF883 family membrane-anchored ribosome-binding protein
MTETTMVEAREQLVSDMRAVIADAEELLSATSGAAGERVAAARARAEATLRDAREKLANLDDAALEQAKQLARGCRRLRARESMGRRRASPRSPACCSAS